MAGPAPKKKTRNFSTFDAELDETVCDRYNNANLTLTMKVGFRQINPAGNYGDPTEPARDIIRWTPAAWTAWKNNFVRSAQAFWHGKFWLINNHPVLEFEDRDAHTATTCTAVSNS